RFRGHGQFGRAELVLAVVAEDHVLDQHAQLLRETGQGGDLLAQHSLRDGDVSNHLAFEGVAEGGSPAQFAHLADVVEDGAGDQQVRVDLGVEGRGCAADAHQGDDVLQQASDPGVVQHLGGGSGAVGCANGLVVEEGKDEPAQVCILEGIHVAAEFGPHFVDVEPGGGNEVRRVDLGGRGQAQLANGD